MDAGGSDANNLEIANLYLFNLKRLMDLIRAAFRIDDLPVVIGRISDSGNDDNGKVWDYGNVVRWQQAKFANQDGNAALVTTTDNYGYSDKWHYDSDGYVDFGKQFAKEMQQLPIIFTVNVKLWKSPPPNSAITLKLHLIRLLKMATTFQNFNRQMKVTISWQ